MSFFRKRRDPERTEAGPPVTAPDVQTAPSPTVSERLGAVTAQMPRAWAVPEPALLQGVLNEVDSCLNEISVPQEIRDHLGAAARQPHDAALLHAAGYALVDAGLGEIAIGVFAAAFALDPTRLDTPIELALALEDVFNHVDAVRVLQHNPDVVVHHPVGAGLLACDAAMAGDLDTLRRVFPSVPAGGPVPFLRAKAEGYLARADALTPTVSLDESALRAWHALLTGGLLLEVFADGGSDMNGRYAAVWLQAHDVMRTIRSLAEVLAHVGRLPGSVASPPDRSSQILGRAVASALAVPFSSELATGTRESPALLVAFDWAAADEFDLSLLRERDDVILFAYFMNWTRKVVVPPDVVGILAQACSAPWDQRMRLARPTGASGHGRPEFEIIPPDPREPAVIASELTADATVDMETPGVPAAVLELCDALRAASAHVGLSGGMRTQYQGPGPVGSNRLSV